MQSRFDFRLSTFDHDSTFDQKDSTKKFLSDSFNIRREE